MKLGTRGSALALAQARLVAGALGDDVAIVVVESDPAAVAENDKARWVSALERALLRGDVDLAVHSAKDVPGDLPDGLELVGAPARADARDAVCGAVELGSGVRVGTSSLRRAAMLRSFWDGVEVVEIRGNVDTRLRKLADGEVDALVLAAAGLERLGRSEEGAPLDALVPAAGQGVIALEARAGDAEARAAAESITDTTTFACLAAERAVVRALDATCDSAVGAHATPLDDGMRVRAWVGAADGSAWCADELAGDSPQALGAEVGARLLAAGAGELLR